MSRAKTMNEIDHIDILALKEFYECLRFLWKYGALTPSEQVLLDRLWKSLNAAVYLIE